MRLVVQNGSHYFLHILLIFYFYMFKMIDCCPYLLSRKVKGAIGMKKFIFLVVIAVLLTFRPSISLGKEEQTYEVIPDEAIRLRILANSNSEKDQQIKREIRDRVNAEITDWVLKLKDEDIETARDVIERNLVDIEEIVQRVLDEHGSNDTFEVTFGDVEFPAKVYGNQVYPAGEYEAVLVTIGEGEGENWWCVLFPPLCFLDFSNGTSVADTDHSLAAEGAKEKKVEVKFFLFEWIEKIIDFLFK
jgi:stage II sporulation protein R